jgi:glycosyltransferase involved in cell wall biosynthesis
MNIGFDAKRAFLNQSGLGNYSRTLIKSLSYYFPNNHYSLFTTKKRSSETSFNIGSNKNTSVILPETFLNKRVTANWRSYVITALLTKTKIDVYHGLSNELPFNIDNFKGKKIVTIHDLIFLRHPKLYNPIDRKIYNTKFKSACELADVIIATSQQTRNDLVEFYSVSPEKIKVVYQSCNDVFYMETDGIEIDRIRIKYNLPNNYLLNVGTVEERKNLITLLRALTIVKDIPLIVIGKKKSYFKKVEKYIEENNLKNRIHFLENIPNEDLPAIYRNSEIFIYPSLFEGFGIPIIEALTSNVPVITTQGGCFEEAGGKDSIYITATNHEQLAEEIKRLLASTALRKSVAVKGFEYSKIFLPKKIANEIMEIYLTK